MGIPTEPRFSESRCSDGTRPSVELAHSWAPTLVQGGGGAVIELAGCPQCLVVVGGQRLQPCPAAVELVLATGKTPEVADCHIVQVAVPAGNGLGGVLV